jgi:hypothetical protein
VNNFLSFFALLHGYGTIPDIILILLYFYKKWENYFFDKKGLFKKKIWTEVVVQQKYLV